MSGYMGVAAFEGVARVLAVLNAGAVDLAAVRKVI